MYLFSINIFRLICFTKDWVVYLNAVLNTKRIVVVLVCVTLAFVFLLIKAAMSDFFHRAKHTMHCVVWLLTGQISDTEVKADYILLNGQHIYTVWIIPYLLYSALWFIYYVGQNKSVNKWLTWHAASAAFHSKRGGVSSNSKLHLIGKQLWWEAEV